MPHTDAIVILTTVASDEEAVKLVRALLERRLIACGTLLPGARSLYRWQGKLADEHEVVVAVFPELPSSCDPNASACYSPDNDEASGFGVHSITFDLAAVAWIHRIIWASQ